MHAIGRYARPDALHEAMLVGPLAGLGAILGNASSLSATAIVTSALGFVFWSLAAREASPAAVGLAAAAISASALLASVSMLGFGTLLIGEVAAARDRDNSLLMTALLVVGACATLLGATFGVLGPSLVQEFQPLSGGLAFIGLFAVSVGGTAVGQLIDQLMVGLLRGELQLGRNTLFSLSKLGALVLASPLLPNDQGIVIFAVWPLGNLLSIIAVCGFLVWRPIGGVGLGRPRLQLLRRMGGAALSHHAVNLTLQAPALVLPILVTVLLSTTANAYFYTASMITSVAVLPQTALATTLYVLGSREPAVLSSRARLTFVLGLVEGLVAIGVVQLAATLLLAGFGARYASEANLTLRILIVAVVPAVIKTHFVALSRVRRRLRTASAAVVAGACVELAAAAVGGHLAGLPGLSAGWLLGLSVEAACMLPYVWQTVASGTSLLPWAARIERSSPR